MSIEWWIILHDRVVKGRRHSRLTRFVQEAARFYFLDDNWQFFRHSPPIRIAAGKQSSNLVARDKFAHVLLSSCWGNFHSFAPHGERSLNFSGLSPWKNRCSKEQQGWSLGTSGYQVPSKRVGYVYCGEKKKRKCVSPPPLGSLIIEHLCTGSYNNNPTTQQQHLERVEKKLWTLSWYQFLLVIYDN